MAKQDVAKLFLTQKSLTEWLEDIKHQDVAALRHEDNEKRERLRELKESIGLPYDEQVQFSARDIADNTPKHAQYVAEHGDELCALRLIPLDKTLPKLRMRGRTVRDVQQWFHDQKIEPTKYRAEYIPHSDNQSWSTIFVVNDHGIFGEIIRGSHNQLTQGFYDDDNRPYTFAFDFTSWNIEPYDAAVLRELQKIINFICLNKDKARAVEKLGFATTHGYLKGYLETTESPEYGLWFVDYAPKMGERLNEAMMPVRISGDDIAGQIGCRGVAQGVVRLVNEDGRDADFPEGAVLVCSMTTPELVPLMQKACAIVTDNGGILSHAAIVARELKKPCIVGTRDATQKLRDGTLVRVDADKGIVEII